ncbi:MAG: serine/threonine protein kinase [Planctomycetota bacterium]|jgi:serine/threonine protein kinase
MTLQFTPDPPEKSRSIRVNRRNFNVIGELHAARRTWPVIERSGRADRERYVVFDRHAGPGGGLRIVFVLNRSQASRQHIDVLRRVSGNCSELPTIHEMRHDGDAIVLIVSWVPGTTLADYLAQLEARQTSRPSPTEAIRLIRGLAHGLSRLHRHRQVVHGDLRPDNLILTSGPSRLVLIDFGSAWTYEAAWHRDPGDGSVPTYAAPELHAATGTLDWRSDQFSLSVILYELLTLQLPYGGLGGSVLKLVSARTAADRLTPPSQAIGRSREIPRSLLSDMDGVVLRGLSLDPNERFCTPGEWLDALDGIHTSIQFLAHAPSQNTRLTRVVESIVDCVERLRNRSVNFGSRSDG